MICIDSCVASQQKFRITGDAGCATKYLRCAFLSLCTWAGFRARHTKLSKHGSICTAKGIHGCEAAHFRDHSPHTAACMRRSDGSALLSLSYSVYKTSLLSPYLCMLYTNIVFRVRPRCAKGHYCCCTRAAHSLVVCADGQCRHEGARRGANAIYSCVGKAGRVQQYAAPSS